MAKISLTGWIAGAATEKVTVRGTAVMRVSNATQFVDLEVSFPMHSAAVGTALVCQLAVGRNQAYRLNRVWSFVFDIGLLT